MMIIIVINIVVKIIFALDDQAIIVLKIFTSIGKGKAIPVTGREGQ
jgi:hypothetical protein